MWVVRENLRLTWSYNCSNGGWTSFRLIVWLALGWSLLATTIFVRSPSVHDLFRHTCRQLNKFSISVREGVWGLIFEFEDIVLGHFKNHLLQSWQSWQSYCTASYSAHFSYNPSLLGYEGYKDGLQPETLAHGNWLVKQNQPVSKIETKSDTNLRSLYESWFRNALISKSVILWWQAKKGINSELEGANARRVLTIP